MATTYHAREGEALDLICYREYGQQAGAVEVVLEANPEIARLAHRLPLGTKVILPDLPAAPEAALGPRLWD